MGDNIKVVVKVRPLIKRELQDKLPCLWQVDDNSIYNISNDGRNHRFTFDRVYDQNTEISDIYNDIAKPIVESATAGINGTIFAYGQTSSGKTFTMMGEQKAPGIIPQAIYNIFENIQNNPDRDFLLRVSYIEIYNEKIKDLLEVDKKDIKICETPQGVKVEASEIVTNSPEQVLEIMNKGVLNRQIGSTNMNEQSSRSHTIFQIIIESKHHAEEGEEEDGCVNVSQLNLVDLAGSERSAQTGATGQRLKEGSYINKSLLSLGLVIKQLSEDPHKFVNYRDSKLTRILQNSLGGNAKTSIICAVTPAAFDETISTLQFANRAKAVKNAPKVNAIATDATMLATLMKKLAKLQYELENKKHLEEDNKLLTEKIRSLQNKIVHGEMVSEGWQGNVNRRQTWCATRRLTIAAIPSSAGQMGPPKNVAIPAFVTPSFERCPPRNKATTRKPSGIPEEEESFVITDDFKETEMTPMKLPTAKKSKQKPKHMRKSVKFSDEIIDLESEEVVKPDTSFCSPDHKCYDTSRTPPCKLRSQIKDAENELSELMELTSLEKMYPLTEVELITRARNLGAKVFGLECDNEALKQDLQERDEQMAVLKEQIDSYQKEKKEVMCDLAKAQEQCALLKEKLNDMENQKDKAKHRELELLSQLAEKSGNNPALSAGDNCKNDIRQVSMLSHFLDLSKDTSLVNNSDIDQSTVNDHSRSNNFQNIQIANLEMQLDEKIRTIAELEEKLSNNKKIMVTLRNECLEKTDKLDILVEKLSAETTAKAKMSKENGELINKIASLEAQLDDASKDVQSYSQLVLDMQQAASRSNSSANPIITESSLSEIMKVRQRLTKNNEELQGFIETYKIALNQKDAELKEKDDTIEIISARAEEYAELLNQRNQDLADLENERLQLQDQMSDKIKFAYKLEESLFETRQKMQHDIKVLQDEKDTIIQESASLSMQLETINADCNLYKEKIKAIDLVVSEKEMLINTLNDEMLILKDDVKRKKFELEQCKEKINKFEQITSSNNKQDKVPCCDGSCKNKILEIKDICEKKESILQSKMEKLSNQCSTKAMTCDRTKSDIQSNTELMETSKTLKTTIAEIKKLQAELNGANEIVAKKESYIQHLELECHHKDEEIEKLTKTNTDINNNNVALDIELKNVKQDLSDKARVIKELENSLSHAKDTTLKQIEANKKIYDAQLSKWEEINNNVTLELCKKQDTLKLNSVKMHRLEAELKESVENLEKCKLEVDSLNTTIRNIMNKLSEKEEQLGKSLQKCEECIAEIKRLNDIISSMGKTTSEPHPMALEEILLQCENYKVEIELVRAKAEESASKLTKTETMLMQRDNEYRDALYKIEKYVTDIHELNLIMEKQKKRINDLEISLTKISGSDKNIHRETLEKCLEQNEKINLLNDTIHVLKGKLLEKETLIKINDAKINKASEKGQQFDLILNKLKYELHELNSKLQEKEIFIAKMPDEILKDLEVLEKYNTKNDKLQVIVSEEKSNVLEVEKILSETKNREKQTQCDLQKCRIGDGEVTRLNGIIEDLTAKLTEQAVLEEYKTKYEKLQIIINEEKNKVLELKKILTETENREKQLQCDLEKCRISDEEITRLNSIIEDLTSKLTEQKVLEEYKTKYEKLQIINEEKSKVLDLKKILTETENREKQLQCDLEECRISDEEITRLNGIIEDLTSKLTEQKVLEENKNKYGKLQVIINEEKSKVLELEKRLIETGNKEKQLQYDLEKCRINDGEISRLNGIIKDLTTKLAEQEILEEYKIKNEKLQVIINEEKSKVLELEKILTETGNREKQLQCDLEKYRISDLEITHLNGIIKDLTIRLAEQETVALVNCKKFETLIENLTMKSELKSAELAEKENNMMELKTKVLELQKVIEQCHLENRQLEESVNVQTAVCQKNEVLTELIKKDDQLHEALVQCNECASEIKILKKVLCELAVKLSRKEGNLAEGNDRDLKVQEVLEKCTKCDSEIQELNVKLDELSIKLTEKKLVLIKMKEEDEALQKTLLEFKKCNSEVDKSNIVNKETVQTSDGLTSIWDENVEKQLQDALNKCVKYERDIGNLNSIISELTAKLAAQGLIHSNLSQQSSEIYFETNNKKVISVSTDTKQMTESLKQYEVQINEYKSQVEELQLSNSDMAALVDLLTDENLMYESKHEILQTENEGLRTNNKYLSELNEDLTSEIREAEEEVAFLMDSIKQLQARIVWHRMNVSTLTATSNTENKLLRSKLISAQHHHNRLHTLCQREVTEMKQQLEKLHMLMQNEMSYYHSPYKQAFSKVHKRDLSKNYLSTPANASLDVTQNERPSFIDDVSFTSDMLMLQTNISINADDTSAKTACNDKTLVDNDEKPKSYINVSCQTESPKIRDCRKKLEYCTPDKSDATCQTVNDDTFEKLQKECTELQQRCQVLIKTNEKIILSLKQAKKEKEEIQVENESLSNDIMDRLTELDTLKDEIIHYKKEITVLNNREIYDDKAPSKLINTTSTQTSLEPPLNAYDQDDYTALKHEVCALKLELTEVLNARDVLLVKLEQVNLLKSKNVSTQTNIDPSLIISSEEHNSSEKPTMLTNRISKIKCELDASREECCKITNELATMKSYIHDSEITSKKICQELENSFKNVNLQKDLDIDMNVSEDSQKCLDKINIDRDCRNEKDERNYKQLLEQNLNLQTIVENLRSNLIKSSGECDSLHKEKMEVKKFCEVHINNLCDNINLPHVNMNTIEMLNSLLNNMDAKYKNDTKNLHIQVNMLQEEKLKIEKKITDLTKDNETFNIILMEETDQCSKLTTNINILKTKLDVLQSEFDLKQKNENEIKNKCGQYISQFMEGEKLDSTINNFQLIDMLVTSVFNRCSSEGKKIISEREHQINEVSNKCKLLSDELENEKQKCENLEKHNAKLKEISTAATLDTVRYKEQVDGQNSMKDKFEFEYQKITKAYKELQKELSTTKIILSKMEEENQRISEENIKLNKEICILKSNLMESKNNVEALTSSLTEERNKCNNLTEHYMREINVLKTQIEDMEREMINLKNLNNVLCNQNKKTADQLNTCNSTMLKNQKDMAAMSEEISHLKILLEEKTLEVTHQASVNSRLKLDCKQKTGNEDVLSKELKKKCKEVEALKINNTTLNKSNNILTGIMNRLNAEIESLKLRLSEQCQKYEDDTNKYKKELKKLQEQLEINNLEVKHGGHPNLEIVEPKVAARKKRQSWHDQSRLSNECPPLTVSKDLDEHTIEELRSENRRLNAIIVELRDKAVQLEKLEFELETSRSAMDQDFCKQSEEIVPKTRNSDCTPRARRQSLHDQSRMALTDFRSIGTNTVQVFDSDLLSMVVDRMTYEAQLEKNKMLQQQVENLRERNRQLSTELRGLTNAASMSMDVEQIQQDVERLRQENEDLQARLKEVDEECEICAQYLRQKEKDYDNLREIKIELEKRVAELEGRAEKEEPRNLILTTRKRRQSIHDQSRTQLGATASSSPDSEERLRNELTNKQREVQDLKEMVADLRNQIDIMQDDKNASSKENVARGGSAIIQNQKISDYIAEICRLRRVNTKLVNLCKKRGRELDTDGIPFEPET